ncbi:MAG: GTP-binding protein [Promethearchaeota archaeon]
MVIKRNKLFRELLGKFLERFSKVEAIIISDIEGLIIAGEKRKDVGSELEIVSVLTTLINPVLERIRNEFSFQKFGTASFDTDEYRLLFVSIDQERILSLILTSMASMDQISPYAYYLAEKSAQILHAQEDDLIQLTIPNFEEEIDRHERTIQKIYQVGGLGEKEAYTFKFVIVGDHEVGKTSIIRRFVERKFSADYRATIGLNILAHKFEFQGNEINLTLWDIGAQQYFKRFRKLYYSGAEAAFLVFDITNRSSFKNLEDWYKEVTEYIEEQEIPMIIVGNKTDLDVQRVVSFNEGQELANSLSEGGLSYTETSALNGTNISDAFKLIAYHYILRIKQKEKDLIKTDLADAIQSALKKLVILELSFISENVNWSPGFQTVVELEKLGEYSKIKESIQEKLYAYKSGLIVNNFLYNNFNLANTDGAFVIFDARNKEHIDPKWKDILIEIIKKIRKKRVIIVGLRVDGDSNISHLMEEFAIEEDLEEKLVSILFLKIGPDYRETIYDNLKVMLNAIVNTRGMK